ncbi:AtpZ/AtpI family protein [Ancylobacter mangrovi]|uniref:AtpZ/AtpI family protein n=1 Tax=Ancylobacter mangrovi TaxID=2972472 RepID=UPI0021632865|nr:AtpZ/AtpI family protein [Ancylobacter mangrovi]MCS0503472.1 AtpZ/AtpI family protein [Ancylobacter mangrovi]
MTAAPQEATPDPPPDRMGSAARQAAERAASGAQTPEPSLGVRLGQIGILGWTIVVPTLLCLVLGRWLDGLFDSGVFFSAPLIMIGAGFGFWSAWKWMHRP